MVLGLGGTVPSHERSPIEVELRWSAPAGCPDADAVRRELEARDVGPSDAMVVTGVVERSDSGFELRLEIDHRSRRESRTLQAESCAALAEAAGLLVAIAAVTQEAEPSESGPPRAVELEPKPVVPSPPIERRPIEGSPSSAVADSAPARRTAVPIGGLVRVDGGLQIFEVLPGKVSGMVGGTIGLRIARVRVEARGRYGPPRRVAYRSRPDIGGRIELWTLGVATCWGPSLRAFEFPLCGGFEAGPMLARSFGVRDNGAAKNAWLAATLDASLVWSPVRWLGLRLGPEVAVAVRRPRFHVRDLPELFRAAPATLRWVFGIEGRFP